MSATQCSTQRYRTRPWHPMAYMNVRTHVHLSLTIPPPLTLEYLGGGKARNFLEIFHLTTWDIPLSTCFLGSKRRGGGPPEVASTRHWREWTCQPTFKAWHLEVASFHQTLEREGERESELAKQPSELDVQPCLQPCQIFLAEIFLGVGGELFEIFQFLPPPPPLKGGDL